MHMYLLVCVVRVAGSDDGGRGDSGVNIHNNLGVGGEEIACVTGGLSYCWVCAPILRHLWRVLLCLIPVATLHNACLLPSTRVHVFLAHLLPYLVPRVYLVFGSTWFFSFRYGTGRFELNE